MADELIGQSLGQYEIRVLLGRGGMSTVYLGYQRSMERTVAIKVLPREFLHDKTFLQRFQQEARTIARLEHLHILPVYDAGEDKGVPYIVMRYLPGGTFADLIAGRLPPIAQMVRLLGQIADALDYAHERGIIHRDLKPSNILLDNANNAFLADFGIARVAEASGLTGQRVIGTPPYIAPEMVKKDAVVTPSVDIYALGIIAFEALTGRPPFYDDDAMKVLMAHALEPVPSVRKVDPNVPVAIDTVLMKCLAKTPEERYKTAMEFAAALSKAATPGPRKAPPQQPPSAQPRVLLPADGPETPVAALAGTPTANLSRGRVLILAALGALVFGLMLTGFAISGGNPIRLLFAGGPSPTPTTTVTPTGQVQASVPPDEPTTTVTPTSLPPAGGGARLAFASERDGDYEVYLVDLDGGNLVQVTENVAPDYDPAWSPDGLMLAYASSTDGDAEIKVIDIGCVNRPAGCDAAAEVLTRNVATDWSPAWSPDGRAIAYSSNADGDYDIYVMNADGSDPRALTFNDIDDFAPRWSPDGLRIIFHSQANDSAGLQMISAQGGLPDVVTSGLGLDLWPDWSPDGGRLVYTSTKGLSDGTRSLFLIDLATGTSTQLTTGPEHDDDGAWSPDGSLIAFDSDRDGSGKFDIYILNLASSVLTRLTDSPGDDVAPAWQPPGDTP